jgi:CheY-like chemotaxis protein
MLSISRYRSRREILVVEDDPDLREAIRYVLLTEGYQVKTAVHGEEALAELRTGKKPCMMILDLMMPVMDGWAVLRELRTDHALPDVSVVVTSANPSGDLHDVTSVLKKPYDVDRLLQIVHQHCDP